jgi:hypothetical protein
VVTCRACGTRGRCPVLVADDERDAAHQLGAVEGERPHLAAFEQEAIPAGGERLCRLGGLFGGVEIEV